MIYLVVLRECFECDNNTPSDKFLAQIMYIKSDKEKAKIEKVCLNELLDKEAIGGLVDFIPLSELNSMRKIGEVW